MSHDLPRVIIYTDGACLGDPGAGPGGYAAVVIRDGRREELSGGFRMTTNNRMELMAAIVALQTLETQCRVTLFSDSQYMIEAMTKGWARGWRARHWHRSNKDKALNPDLWEQLLDLCDKHAVEFVWVKGHAGNLENERCDALSLQAAGQPDLPPDRGYDARADEVQYKNLSLWDEDT